MVTTPKAQFLQATRPEYSTQFQVQSCCYIWSKGTYLEVSGRADAQLVDLAERSRVEGLVQHRVQLSRVDVGRVDAAGHKQRGDKTHDDESEHPAGGGLGDDGPVDTLGACSSMPTATVAPTTQ